MNQFACASLSHTHYWYKEGVLKVSAVTYIKAFSITLMYRFTSIMQGGVLLPTTEAGEAIPEEKPYDKESNQLT